MGRRRRIARHLADGGGELLGRIARRQARRRHQVGAARQRHIAGGGGHHDILIAERLDLPQDGGPVEAVNVGAGRKRRGGRGIVGRGGLGGLLHRARDLFGGGIGGEDESGRASGGEK